MKGRSYMWGKGKMRNTLKRMHKMLQTRLFNDIPGGEP
jgi:hypothetical protein